MSQPFSLTTADPERTLEYEFVRATENAALNCLQWLGRGEKELADAAACDANNGVFDLVDNRIAWPVLPRRNGRNEARRHVCPNQRSDV